MLVQKHLSSVIGFILAFLYLSRLGDFIYDEPFA